MGTKDKARKFSTDAEEEYAHLEQLERLETVLEEMEDLHVTTLAEVVQRIAELNQKLDQKQ